MHPWTIKAAQHSWAGGGNETATAANAALRVPLLCWESILRTASQVPDNLSLVIQHTVSEHCTDTHCPANATEGPGESPDEKKLLQKSMKTIQQHGGVLAQSDASARSPTTASSTTSLRSFVHHAKALSSTTTSSFGNDAIYFNKRHRKKGPFRRLKRSAMFET